MKPNECDRSLKRLRHIDAVELVLTDAVELVHTDAVAQRFSAAAVIP
jgi:hypothetical protein